MIAQSSSHAAPSASPPPPQCSAPPTLDRAARAQLALPRPVFTSLGHGGGLYNATVRGNAAAFRAADSVGALWVMEHNRIDGAGPGPVFAMERRTPDGQPRHAGWCYFVVEPDGTLLRSGELPDCVGCHAATPSRLLLSAP